MSIGTFVIVGFLAGFIASKFIIKTGDGLPRDLGLGVAGTVLVAYHTFFMRIPQPKPATRSGRR